MLVRRGLRLLDELIQHPGMLLYRTLFVLFGVALGWLLWQRNKHERDFRALAEVLKQFRQECARGGCCDAHKTPGTVDP